MLTAAKLILHSHNKSTELGCLASTGILKLKPGSTNTVPGYVQFSLDLRTPDDAKLLRLEETLKLDFEQIAKGADAGNLNAQGTKGKSCEVIWKTDSVSPSVLFHNDCISCIEDSAKALFGEGSSKRMTSGAGHDR